MQIVMSKRMKQFTTSFEDVLYPADIFPKPTAIFITRGLTSLSWPTTCFLYIGVTLTRERQQNLIK